MNKKVVLLHGYSKNKNDMKVMESHLTRLKFECILVDLPLTFKEIHQCASIFEGIFEGLLERLGKDEKVSLVGHSSGGLVIRKFLSDTKHIDKVDKCVLIATPNNGTELASYAWSISKSLVNIFKTLKSLQPDHVQKLHIQEKVVDIGAIAGNKSSLLLGKFLKNENDGRVEVQSVYYQGLKDFIVLPYSHKEIHYEFETAKLIKRFIHSNQFH
jgi:triacylglycerol esterase/lipase EstA (alpha/beta hydrolase family)